MGGQNIFHVGEDNSNLAAILDVLTKKQTVTIMAQKYIPDIAESGDKRILLIAGKPVPYALARIPAPNKFRGNLAHGASSKVVALTEKELLICEKLSASLLEQGLYFVGIDVIGRFLTEINITSPTCIKEIEKETGIDIARQYIKYLATIAG